MASLASRVLEAAEPRVPRVAVASASDRLLPADVADVLGAPPAFPVSVRLQLDVADAAALRAADKTIADYEARHLKLWLATPMPATERDAEAWRGALRTWLAAHQKSVAILELRLSEQAMAAAPYTIRAASTDLRVAVPNALLAIGGVPADRIAGLLTRDLAAYVDLVAVTHASDAPQTLSAVAAQAPAVNVVVTGDDLPADPSAAATAYATGAIDALGTRVVALCARGASGTVRAALRAVRPAASLLTGDVDAVDPAASSLRITDAGGAPNPPIAFRLLFENRSFGTYLFYSAAESGGSLDVRLNVPVEGMPTVFDLASGTSNRARGYRRDGAAVQVEAPRTGHPMLIDFNADATGEVLASRAEVTAVRQITVEEIIARHRQQQAAQDAAVDHYQALVRMEQHFRPTLTDPGYDVVTENRYFSSADDVEWEELSFSVNGSRFDPKNRPPFPLLQPEKVLSLPLQLRFSDDYRYRLAGTERVDGFDCYVVKFDPIDQGRSLYRGTVWIDRVSFARVRVSAVQTHLSAPVISNEEDQRYEVATSIDGRPIFLLMSLSARQIVMIAGRNLLVERSVAFRDVKVNDASFLDARGGARKSENVMYRDTDKGVRYYVKSGDTRVVSDRPTTKAKAAAMGVTVDPSFAFPLPIFGINYLNFAFRNPDTQFAMLFGGVLAAINIQRPKVPHTPFDASLDFFGIAVPSSDRVYDGVGEHPAERVITWPLTTGINLGWQYTAFQKAMFQYQFRFDGYHADTTTTDAFVVPSSTLTNGLGGAYEYRRGGYSLVLNGAWYGRASWRPWGLSDPARPDEGLEEPQRTYVRYSGNLSRDFFLGPFQKVHLNGGYFGGERLDRFSRYQFGLFDDTRIHGVPASGVRFDDLAMARGAYTFDLLQMYRFDFFLDQAWGRDLSATRDWQRLTGIGIAFNVRAPYNTILRADVGHAWLPPQYRGIGSTVVQILLLKPLGS
ncbi:MAG TPA: hypothetical protein VH458_06160 [Vicinamibacterales bacterium]|jgi:hypothetical protein